MFAKDAKETAKMPEKKKPVARRWKGVPATHTVEDRSQRRTSTTSDASPPRLKEIPAAFQFLGCCPPVFGLVARQYLGCPAHCARSQRLKVPLA